MKTRMNKLRKRIALMGAMALLLPASAWAADDLTFTNSEVAIYSLLTVAVVIGLALVLVSLVLYAAFYLKLKKR